MSDYATPGTPNEASTSAAISTASSPSLSSSTAHVPPAPPSPTPFLSTSNPVVTESLQPSRPAIRTIHSRRKPRTTTIHNQQRPVQSDVAMDSVIADATCKKLVAILALAAGFEGITASALYTLTNAFEDYTQQMYKIAHSFAELAGRTQPNVCDLQQAFSDMNLTAESLEGYIQSASSSSTPLLRGPLQETIAKPKKKKEKKPLELDSDIEDNSDSDDELEQQKDAAGNRITARTTVPDHLPPFPSKHSFKQTG
ncbi:hypothetical protein BG004_008103, partial [Podila humilis]